MKLFVDTGDANVIVEHQRKGITQGATTNPTLMHAAGVTDYEGYAKDLLARVPTDFPISLEVFAEEFDEMERQARLIAKWGENVSVKIPAMNIAGEDSFELVHRLSHNGIKLNVTAIFTARQVEAVVKALDGGAPAIVSVFAGRIANTSVDPIPMMRTFKKVCQSAAGEKPELLWASTREVLNLVHAEQGDCDIITVTPSILAAYLKDKDKDLEVFSLETVQMFDRDAKAAGFRL